MAAQEHFDAVVVGSGFGGGVSAYRLAGEHAKVCVLERGKAYAPREFPRSPAEMATNFWDPSEGGHGMFNFWSFRGLEALVSAGLGGGSLIYANVLLPMDPEWFERVPRPGGGFDRWPIRRQDLDPHYDQVRDMLDAQKFPIDKQPYARTPKAVELRRAATELHYGAFTPELAVTFANRGEEPAVGMPIRERYPSLHGQPRFTCRLCGECDIGCNTGSKNTVDHTYLSAAKTLGADIRVRCEVRGFEPVPKPGGGYTYLVRYVRHDPGREGLPTDTSQLHEDTISADQLILAAGTLGTTFLLLKNRDHFPHLSPALGTRFCGNGDLLGFVTRSHVTVDGRRQVRRLAPSVGPVITTAVRVPDTPDANGYYVEDGGFPEFVGWMIEARDMPGTVGRVARFLARRAWAFVTANPRSDYSAEILALLGKGELSAGAMPLLGMGSDTPDGMMRLRRGNLQVNWTTKTSRGYFDRVQRTMQDIAAKLDADFVDNPSWFLRRVITVHPLGGCPMGIDQRHGVVDDHGEVFNYPGLFITDGSVMPGPVGANPALTIAAFADRAADRFAPRAARRQVVVP